MASPESDPIRDAFIDAELAEMIDDEGSDHSLSEDPIDRLAVEHGIDSDDVAALKALREAAELDRIALHNEASKLLADHLRQTLETGDSTLLTRWLSEGLRNMDQTGEDRFMPITMFRDDITGQPGLTVEEWNELPESTRETLRGRRPDDPN